MPRVTYFTSSRAPGAAKEELGLGNLPVEIDVALLYFARNRQKPFLDGVSAASIDREGAVLVRRLGVAGALAPTEPGITARGTQQRRNTAAHRGKLIT